MRHGGAHAKDCRTARSRSAGFTLIELLIALTLVGLLSVVLIGSLRFGTRVWETGHQRSEAFAQIEAVHGFLRRQIGQAIPPGQTVRSRNRLEDFEGLSERVRFTAPFSAFIGVGGLYRFELAPVERPEGMAVELTWQLYRPDREEWFEDDDTTQRTLVEDIEAIRLSYYGTLDEDDEPDWHDEWESQSSLPALLKLELEFPAGDQRAWPVLTVAPHAATNVPL